MKHFFLTFFVFLFLYTSLLFCQNLLQNPGFENWTGDSICDYWDKETGGFDAVKESSIVHSGSFSAKLVLRSTSTQRFTQYVKPVTPGDDYEGSFYCFDNEPYGRVRLYIRWFDGSGNWISSFWSSYSVDSTGWQQLTAGPDVAPSSAETVHVEIRQYDVTGFTDSAIIYADDASFVDLSGIQETLTPYNETSFSIYPNLTMKSVNINLAIAKSTYMEISIYNISGRKITTLISENVKTGKHNITWDGKDKSGRYVPPGIYFIKSRIGRRVDEKKVSIIR